MRFKIVMTASGRFLYAFPTFEEALEEARRFSREGMDITIVDTEEYK